jgi:hypothetical protein
MEVQKMGKIRAIGYTRVSTSEQASEGYSLAAQEAKIRAYADLYDLDLVGIETARHSTGQLCKELLMPSVPDRQRRSWCLSWIA